MTVILQCVTTLYGSVLYHIYLLDEVVVLIVVDFLEYESMYCKRERFKAMPTATRAPKNNVLF